MSAPEEKNRITPIVMCVWVPLAGAIGATTFGIDTDWFENELVHPSWRPPNWIFRPIWAILYFSMGIACYHIWRDGQGLWGRNVPLVIYLMSLNANWLWMPIFFSFHSILVALIDVILLWVLILITMIIFYRIKPIAAYFLIPYWIWVTIGTALNTHYYILNR